MLNLELDPVVTMAVAHHVLALDKAVELVVTRCNSDIDQDTLAKQLLHYGIQRYEQMGDEDVQALINRFSTYLSQIMPPRLVYWQDETSGQLAAAVQDYLIGTEPMQPESISALAHYLKIWIDYPWQVGEGEMRSQMETLRQSFDAMVRDGNRETIGQWLEQLLVIGVDPL